MPISDQITYHPGPPQPTPEQRLFIINDEEWEVFIEECANQLKKEGVYHKVIRLGGAGDKGRDVCGYTNSKPVKGSWDLYQAKYYSGTLSPSEFAPELAKFLFCVYNKAYTCPRSYYVCALKIGPKLVDLILNPHEMKKWIIKEWKDKNGKFGSFNQNLTSPLESFVKKFNFGIFERETPAELLEIHCRSNKHWERFGFLPNREDNPLVPEDPDPKEQNYVDALMKVYSEESNSMMWSSKNGHKVKQLFC